MTRMPKYRLHKSTGQAIATFNGTDFYLGLHSTEQSQLLYQDLCRQYKTSGGKTPTKPVVVQFTVGALGDKYLEHCKTLYGDSADECLRLGKIIRLLKEHFPDITPDGFGPKALRELRDHFVESGNSRKYVNRQTNWVVRMFKWGVAEELVAIETYQKLKALEPLRFGQSKAKELPKRQPVPIEQVKATIKEMPVVVAAMARLQILTGMRPGELCKLRPMDVEFRDDDAWVYRPESHKNTWRGKRREIPIVGAAQDVLRPFLTRKNDAFCFSPRESMILFRQQQHAKRTTPLSCGNKPGSNIKPNPKKQPGEQYNPRVYRQTVQRAAARAGMPQWCPYQIRHTVATMTREMLGVEGAQALLGHARADMTEHYAEIQLEKAIEAAQAIA